MAWVMSRHAGARDDVDNLCTWRPLPSDARAHADPFVLLSHHGPHSYPAKNRGLPFGLHPHRGFETVTFVLQGSLQHKDRNSEVTTDAGGVQWLTAGRGAVHAEQSPKKFMEQGGSVELVQLWVNLPSRWKMVPSRFRGLQKRDLPTHRAGAAMVTPVAGEWFGEHGPFEPITDVGLARLDVDAGGRVVVDVKAGQVCVVYVVDGSACGAVAHDIVVFDPADADGNDGAVDSVVVDAGAAGAVVIVGTGTPFGEPVVSVGPFVMNTDEEIRQALFDARMGRMDRG
jgi:redox-sensitive bicupin YhaK (pirin superfamily)